MKNKEIARLVIAVQKKEGTAFEKLFQSMWNIVYYTCYKQLGSESDAEDAAQEVFLSVYKNIENLKAPEAFNSWVNKIVFGICERHRQKKKVQTIEFDEIEGESAIVEENKEFLPLEILEQKEAQREIAQIVEKLPEKQKEAVILYYYQGLSQSEICTITNSTRSAVNDRLWTARNTLKNYAEKFAKDEKIFAIMPVPVLMQILKGEAEMICKPEIMDKIWGNISKEINLSLIEESVKKPKQNSFVTYSLVAVSIASIVLGGVLLSTGLTGVENVPSQVNNVVISDDIIKDLRKVKNSTEFEEFAKKYQFEMPEKINYAGETKYLLVSKKLGEKKLFAGYEYNPQVGFKTAYQFVGTNVEPANDLESWIKGNYTIEK